MSGFRTQFNAALATGENVANQVAKPIFDALGNTLGWIAAETAPFIGAGNAVAVTNSVGITIGTLYTSETQGVQAIAQGAEPILQTIDETAVQAFDQAGQAAGTFVQNLWQKIFPWLAAGIGLWIVVDALGD